LHSNLPCFSLIENLLKQLAALRLSIFLVSPLHALECAPAISNIHPILIYQYALLEHMILTFHLGYHKGPDLTNNFIHTIDISELNAWISRCLRCMSTLASKSLFLCPFVYWNKLALQDHIRYPTLYSALSATVLLKFIYTKCR
jgi:hypothetical protein